MNAMIATQEWIRVLQMENKFVRAVPSNNADADPSSSCVRDYSCLSSMTAGKRKQIGIRSSRLVLPRTTLPRTSSNPGQNQNSSSNPGQNKTPVRILVKMKTPAPILVSLPRMATHNVPERASSQISKSQKCPREQISDSTNFIQWLMAAATSIGFSSPSPLSRTSAAEGDNRT